jgi:small-conductance mechanosensitive channel
VDQNGTVTPAVATPLLAAAPASTCPTGTNQGYVYHLLRCLGASETWSRTGQLLVVRPLEIIVILVLAWLAARLGSRVARRVVRSIERRSSGTPDARRAPQRMTTVAGLLASIWRIVVWIVAALTILGTIGIDLTPFLAGATVLGATIGFGAQSLVRDFLSGVFIVAEDQYGIGDTITIGTTVGVVEELTLRVTRMRSADGTVWYVRNGEISQVGNDSVHWSRAVVDVVVPVGTNVETAGRVIGEEADAVATDPRWAPWCLSPPEVQGVVSSDATGVTIRVRVRTAVQQDGPVGRALRARINDRLLAEAIIGPAGG